MPSHVSVAAAARLHLGFLDMNGSLGRKFGGLGLAISGPATRLALSRSTQMSAAGPDSLRAAALLEKAAAALAPGAAYRLTIEEAIPPHAGLGSGTQLALAIAAAVRRLEGLPMDAGADAALLARGARSGLGAGLFAQGGLVVDGGRGARTTTPPVIARLPFPARWRILLIQDPSAAGLHGAGERDAFSALPPFPEQHAAELCRLVLMRALPAAAEDDLPAFGAAIARIQAIVGDYFAPMQGGRRFTSRAVEELLDELMRDGAVGAGQTSWGPTGFAFVADETKAQALAARARGIRSARSLRIAVAEGLDRGARITTAGAMAPAAQSSSSPPPH